MYYKDITLTGLQAAIGYEDENLPTRVIIDISDLTKYGTGTTVLEVKRPCDGEAYIAEQTEVDGNNFYWYPTKGDLEVSGLLKCQVKAVIGDQIVKTRVYYVRVIGALNGDGTLSGVVPDALQTFVESASGSEDAAKASAEEAKKAEEAAKASETAAKKSETNAKASETAAKASETAAKKSETNAKASETAAKASETAAAKSASDADASAQAAADSAKNAATSESNAKTYASNASDSAMSAASSAASIKASADQIAANTDALGGHTVKSDVPADAKFTDTVYDDSEIKRRVAVNASDIADVNNHLEQGLQMVQAKQDATPSSALTDPAGTGIQLVANQKIDYDKLADAIIAKYQGQTLAGKAQSVKSALDLVKNQTDGIIDVVNGKPFENVRWSGEKLGSTFTAEQLAYIQNNEGYQLGLGSYWTDEAQGITWRNLHFNFLLNKGDPALKKYHSLVMPDACLLKSDGSSTRYMQDIDDSTTANGYNGTKYRSTYRSQCKTKFANFFGSHVLTHREMLTNASTNGQASGWSWYDCDVELPSEDMMYGSSPWGNSTSGGGSGYNVGINYGRIAGFESHPELINAFRENYWLRTICTGSHFAYVGSNGYSQYAGASSTWLGLRPYALIG